jgi:hypothetical protein
LRLITKKSAGPGEGASTSLVCEVELDAVLSISPEREQNDFTVAAGTAIVNNDIGRDCSFPAALRLPSLTCVQRRVSLAC